MSGPTSRRKRSRSNGQGLEMIGAVLERASRDEADQGRTPLPLWIWQEAVGHRVARRARPMRLSRGVLSVRAATSVWAQELTFLAPTIVARLRAAGIKVDSLRFNVGPVEPLPERDKAPRVTAAPAARPLEHHLAGAIDRVEDAGLRTAITRAARANLAWQDATRPATSTKPAARAPRFAGPESAEPAQKRRSNRGESPDKS